MKTMQNILAPAVASVSSHASMPTIDLLLGSNVWGEGNGQAITFGFEWRNSNMF